MHEYNRNCLTEAENKLVVTSGERGGGGRARQEKGIKRYKLLGIN